MLMVGAAATFSGWAVPTRTSSPADEVAATADGENIWIANSIADRNLLILHHGPDDEMNAVHPGPKFHGRLAPQGLASSKGRLWLIYDNHSVQSIRQTSRLTPEFSPYEYRTEKSLEKGLTLRSLAANAAGLWVLASVEDTETLKTIDALPIVTRRQQTTMEPTEFAQVPAPATRNQRIPLESSTFVKQKKDTNLSQDQPRGRQPNKLERFQPTDHLLKLGHKGWENFRLPDDWPHGIRSWLIMRGPDIKVPVLISVSPDELHLRYDYHTNAIWKTRTYLTGRTKTLVVAAIRQQLIVAWQGDQSDATTIHISLLRPEGLNAMEPIHLETANVHSWTLVDGGGSHPITILSWNGRREFSVTRMDLMGRATATASLQMRPRRTWTNGIDKLILVLVLAVATLIMFVYWRRDPSWNRPQLPQTLALANLTRRGIAGLVDLAPAAFIATIVHGVPAVDLVTNWPGHGEWMDLGPWFIMVGVYLAHSLLAELFTARSMGKALMGLRITDLTGKPPNIWQVLARNVMKVFELIAWPLLMMPAIGPYRQRLGDMMARTLVVMKTDPNDNSSSNARQEEG